MMFDTLPDFDGELDANALKPLEDVIPTVDYVAYFEAFCHAHSGEGSPMQYGGTLIFPDGWTYDAYHHEGPENEPPEDSYSLLRLRALYWTLRLRLLRRHYSEFVIRVRNLKHLQQFKSSPLMVSRIVKQRSKTTGQLRYVQRSSEVDFDHLEIEQEGLQREIELCESKLTDLRIEIKNLKVMTPST